MIGLNDLEIIPYSIWVLAAATGIIIVLLTLFLQLFYRKRLQAMDPLNTDVGDLINQKQQLETDVDSIKDWIAIQKDELLRLEAERKEQEIIRAELLRLEQEAAKRQDENKDQIDEVGNLENQRHLLVQSMEKLEKEKTEIEKDIKALGKENEDSKNALKEIEKELKKFEKEEKKLTDAIEKGNKKLNEIEDDHKKLEKAIKEAKDSLNATENKAESLEKEIKEMEKVRKQKEEEVTSLDNTKTDLSARIETLSEELNSAGILPREAFDSLNQPFIDKPGSSRANLSEEDALKALYRLTANSGFDLPERLQNAFHTSLKTSDISCLTVMAGVSGTGKSAFPKLYCQSMGLHFLPLAVEPRWDSPQDLFGFLNYMEKRFEPTPLGRALVQFNNSPHFSENSKLNNQVLLVLLDEMNLARIEYYFSEFLSKLEMRRNVNIDNSLADYRMVSTEIYAGNQGDEERGIKKSDPIYLYAGSNVLFVGTMNEDETTQSLSDKVIDRANVLYFGKPDKLKNQKQEVIDEQTNWAPINVNNWKEWIVEPNNRTINDIEKIGNLLNRINDTLAKLGRPFGWRTYKAMMSYIANHPDVNIQKNSAMGPLSDQVAMRVMPKLRGLDLGENSEVFTMLLKHLSIIEDESLIDAFKKAQNSSMGYFDWRGIQWGKK
jgi:hypothetical protein